MSDHWTHHDPAVRELIAEHSAKAWDEGVSEAVRYAREGCPQSRNPYKTAGPGYEPGSEHHRNTNTQPH